MARGYEYRCEGCGEWVECYNEQEHELECPPDQPSLNTLMEIEAEIARVESRYNNLKSQRRAEIQRLIRAGVDVDEQVFGASWEEM